MVGIYENGQYGRHTKLLLPISLSILVTLPVSSGSMNAIRTVPTAVDDLAVTAILNYKMAATKKLRLKFKMTAIAK